MLKRILALLCVLLMLSPIMSFATDTEDTDTTVDTESEETTDDATTEDASTDTAVTASYGYSLDSEAERKAEAIEDAVYDSKEDLLAAYTTYRFVSETDSLELYLEDTTMGLIIRNKNSGAIIKSVLSKEEAASRSLNYSETIYSNMCNGISIMACAKYTDSVRNQDYQQLGAPIGCDQATIEYTEIDNGFSAEVEFKITGIAHDGTITIVVNVYLDDEGLHVDIPYDQIVIDVTDDEDDSLIRLEYISVYQLMGFTQRGDRDGYMIIPDGNGAIIDYEDFVEVSDDGTSISSTFASQYLEWVYGEDLSYVSQANSATEFGEDAISEGNDTELILAPYWGQVHEDTGFAVLAVVDEGDEQLRIEASVQAVNGTLENYVGPRFYYGYTYTKPTNESSSSGVDTLPADDFVQDIAITYLFTEGTEASFTGLANAYREHLISRGELSELEETAALTMRIDFLGTDKEDFLIFKKTVTATTVSNIREIVDDLLGNGVENLELSYIGWQDGGVYDLPVTKYDVSSAIGGKIELNSLVEDINELDGVSFSLSTDMLYLNYSIHKIASNMLRKITGFTYKETRFFEEVYQNFRILTPSASAENMVSLAEELADAGYTSVTYTGVSNTVFSFMKNSTIYSKGETMDIYSEAFATVTEDLELALENPIKSYWQYTDKYYGLSLSTSSFAYETSEIPFVSTVLSGCMEIYSEYVNFEADKSDYFIKLATYGINPSFIITYENPSILQYTNSNDIYTSQYDHYAEQIAEYYKELTTISELKDGSSMIAYDIDGDIHTVVYENGLVIVADYAKMYLVAYKEGKVVYSYVPAEERELTSEELGDALVAYRAYANAQAVAEYVDDALLQSYSSVGYYYFYVYSNGISVVKSSVNGVVYVLDGDTPVYGYYTSTGTEMTESELSSFSSLVYSTEGGETDVE